MIESLLELVLLAFGLVWACHIAVMLGLYVWTVGLALLGKIPRSARLYGPYRG